MPFTQQEVVSLAAKFFQYVGYEKDSSALRLWCEENFDALKLADNGIPVSEVITKCTGTIVEQIMSEENVE